jgi:hypothetical protein
MGKDWWGKKMVGEKDDGLSRCLIRVDSRFQMRSAQVNRIPGS